MITQDGATIQLANKLGPDSEMIVRNLQTELEAMARVVGLIRENSAGHVYGVALMDSSVDLWRVPLLPNNCARPTILECSRCHTVKSLPLTEIEMEIFKSKRAVTRHCGCSVASTIWKETTREETVERKVISPRGVGVGQPEASSMKENRRDKRVAIKAVACIRYGGREEIAKCEDMSRRGFRFKSRKEYPAGTRIEAAVPYVHSNVNIFVPAQIAYHQELSAVSHRHGVTYLNNRRGPGQK